MGRSVHLEPIPDKTGRPPQHQGDQRNAETEQTPRFCGSERLGNRDDTQCSDDDAKERPLPAEHNRHDDEKRLAECKRSRRNRSDRDNVNASGEGAPDRTETVSAEFDKEGIDAAACATSSSYRI